MPSSDRFEIRQMKRQDLDVAVEWAAQEGWNPGLHDAGTFFTTDPKGFFMAFSDGEPIGAISAVAYDHIFGFVGFFIVRPEFRGHRVGVELGRHALQYLRNRNIGVDGVEAKIKNYEAVGFKLAYNNIRYEGLSQPSDDGRNLVDATSLDFQSLEKYDQQFFPVPRPTFLQAWIRQTDTIALAAVKDDQIEGYGVIRPCRVGFKIGPLFADDASVAQQLFSGLTSRVPAGSAFYLDIPGVNEEAVKLVTRHNMKAIFKTARMYNKAFPELPLNRIFGVTSFELG
jgi:GNAT superfamily N-acetyltransferase